MQLFRADTTIIFLNSKFIFCPWKPEETLKKVAHNRPPFFQNCQPVQISNAFHRNLPPRVFSIMTLAVGIMTKKRVEVLWQKGTNHWYFQTLCRAVNTADFVAGCSIIDKPQGMFFGRNKMTNFKSVYLLHLLMLLQLLQLLILVLLLVSLQLTLWVLFHIRKLNEKEFN